MNVNKRVAFISTETILGFVALDTGADHVFGIKALDITGHLVHPGSECGTGAILARILVARFVHQFPGKDGGIVFIRHTGIIVDPVDKMLQIIFVTCFTARVGKEFSPVHMAGPRKAFPSKPGIDAAISFPIVFQGNNNLDPIIPGGFHNVIK